MADGIGCNAKENQRNTCKNVGIILPTNVTLAGSMQKEEICQLDWNIEIADIYLKRREDAPSLDT